MGRCGKLGGGDRALHEQPSAVHVLSPGPRRGWADVKYWAIALPILLVLLVGRYDFGAARHAISMRAYLASACILVQVLPAVFYTLLRSGVRRRAAIWITVIVAVVCVLPYRWLGMASSGIWSDTVKYDRWWIGPNQSEPTVDWLPHALAGPAAIPHEWLVFSLLIASGALPLLWASGGRPTGRWFRAHPAWGVGTAAFLLIVLESWLHLSMRAPYSYLVHYSDRKPDQQLTVTNDADGTPHWKLVDVPRPHGWWHIYLFPDHQGAVHADYDQFRACEQLFQGTDAELDSGIIRRLLTFYFSSQFTCFFNPYYVFLFLNTACWLAAVLAGYVFALRHVDRRCALFFALFIAGGSGFIFFVNQPMCYLSGYAAVMVLIALFEEIVANGVGNSDIWLFGLLYGLGMLVTDLWMLFPFFLVYGLIRRVAFWRAATAVLLAFGFYGLTLLFLSRIAGVPDVQGNTNLLWNASGSGVGGIDGFYMLCLQCANRFAMDMFHAFMILPVLAALVGLAFARSRKRILITLALLIPAAGTVVYLDFYGVTFKDWPLAALPRLAYVAYPAVYLLAAIGVIRGSRVIGGRGSRWAEIVPWVFLGLVIVVNNVDVFGIPAIYYHFYFGMDVPGLMPFGHP
jgi:hypothetical protein